MSLNSLYEYVMAFLFPPFCCCCGESVRPGKLLCRECGFELDSLSVKKSRVRTINGVKYRLHSIYRYSDSNAASTIVKRVKFGGKLNGTRLMGAKIARKAARLGEYDAVTFVPITREKESKRGFNQCEYIASEVSSHLKVKLLNCLDKRYNTVDQHSLRGKERTMNVEDSFCCVRRLDGMRLLLIDDVITTGSTMCECAAVLYAAGAQKVTMVSFSMT